MREGSKTGMSLGETHRRAAGRKWRLCWAEMVNKEGILLIYLQWEKRKQNFRSCFWRNNNPELSEAPIPIILSLTALCYLSGCRSLQPVVISPTSNLPLWLPFYSSQPPLLPHHSCGRRSRQQHWRKEKWVKSSRCDYKRAPSTATWMAGGVQ